jgi:hypothetical protein
MLIGTPSARSAASERIARKLRIAMMKAEARWI